jgi:hypothetical protein
VNAVRDAAKAKAREAREAVADALDAPDIDAVEVEN